MRVAALVLGIIGGLFGLVAASAALAIGGIGAAFGSDSASLVVGGGWAALALSIVGIVGASLALAKPKIAGAMMLVAAIGGVVCVFVAYLLPAPLLLVG